MMNRLGFLLTSIVIAFFLLTSMVFVVDQRQFGVIYSFGKIQSIVTEPGLVLKWPDPFQNVEFIDKRLRNLDSSGTDSIQTVEKQNIVVDWFVRWRITSPVDYIRNVGSEENARTARLTQVVRNAFQEEINKLTVKDLLSEKRETLMKAVRKAVTEDVNGSKGRPWGVEIVDVRMTRMDFPKEITESVYRRMAAERQRVANELRSIGAADGEKIRADADKQRDILVAQAYREAQRIKGESDAKAGALYANSYGKDANFAAFFRNLEAYKTSIGQKGDVMVVDPASSEFFKAMRGK